MQFLGNCVYVHVWLSSFADVMYLHFIFSQIDHSVVESFDGEGRTCITARVYPKLAIDKEAYLYVFNNGTLSVRISKLSAWSMKRAQIFPIKKRRKPQIN